MVTQETQEQERREFIEDLLTICNETIEAVLRDRPFVELLRNLEGSLLSLKTDRWDGASLTALEVFYARKATLDGLLALRRNDPEAAVAHHKRAEAAYKLYAVTTDDWLHIENNYHWLIALAASRASFEERYARYSALSGLFEKEQLHTWSLAYIGYPYYRLSTLLSR